MRLTPRRVITLVVALLLVDRGAFTCDRDVASDPPSGTVVSIQPARDRVAVTIRAADGDEWVVRLEATTACVVDAVYPACTEE